MTQDSEISNSILTTFYILELEQSTNLNLVPLHMYIDTLQ